MNREDANTRKLIRDQEGLDLLGHKLRQVRERVGMTQEDLAFGAGISVSQVSRIENGIINPTVSTMFYIARALELPLSELFDFTLAPFDK